MGDEKGASLGAHTRPASGYVVCVWAASVTHGVDGLAAPPPYPAFICCALFCFCVFCVKRALRSVSLRFWAQTLQKMWKRLADVPNFFLNVWASRPNASNIQTFEQRSNTFFNVWAVTAKRFKRFGRLKPPGPDSFWVYSRATVQPSVDEGLFGEIGVYKLVQRFAPHK